MKTIICNRAAGGTLLHRASDGRHRSDAGLLGRTLAGRLRPLLEKAGAAARSESDSSRATATPARMGGMEL